MNINIVVVENITCLADIPITTNKKIDLLKFSLGHNKLDTGLDLNDFVTYVRKEDLKYDQDYYEKFVLVFINKGLQTICRLLGYSHRPIISNKKRTYHNYSTSSCC